MKVILITNFHIDKQLQTEKWLVLLCVLSKMSGGFADHSLSYLDHYLVL